VIVRATYQAAPHVVRLSSIDGERRFDDRVVLRVDVNKWMDAYANS
jgi:hypothetical protein